MGIYGLYCNPPVVDINLPIDQAVERRELAEIAKARDRTQANRSMGHRRYRPKKPNKTGGTIYFLVNALLQFLL
jgi:hypothetical protein